MKEVAEHARAFVQRGVEALRDRVQGLGSKEVQSQESPPSLAVDRAASSQVNPADELARQLEQFRAAGRQGRTQRDLKIESAKPELVKEQELERERSLQKENEKAIEIKSHGHGFSR